MENTELPNGLTISTDILNDQRLNINEKIVLSVMSNPNITNKKAKTMKLLGINATDFSRIISYLDYLELFDAEKKKEAVKENEKGINIKELLKEMNIEEAYEAPINKWLEYKKTRKQKYAHIGSIKTFIKKLVEISDNSPQIAEATITNSIANNWSGTFELSGKEKERAAQNTVKVEKQDEEYTFATEYNAR